MTSVCFHVFLVYCATSRKTSGHCVWRVVSHTIITCACTLQHQLLSWQKRRWMDEWMDEWVFYAEDFIALFQWKTAIIKNIQQQKKKNLNTSKACCQTLAQKSLCVWIQISLSQHILITASAVCELACSLHSGGSQGLRLLHFTDGSMVSSDQGCYLLCPSIWIKLQVCSFPMGWCAANWICFQDFSPAYCIHCKTELWEKISLHNPCMYV